MTDDGYIHGLRVYEDFETGAVRLQASVHEGELKRYVKRLMDQVTVESRY